MKKCSTLSRLLAFALVLCLCAAFVPMMTFAEETESVSNADVWDGTSASEELKTDSDGAYLIQSAADLACFRDTVNDGTNYVGKVVKLTTDINWNGQEWTCGTWGKWFSGTLDGQGHTLSGLRVPDATNITGLFSYASGTAVAIKNLILTDYQINSTKHYVGGLFGGMNANTTVTIENVYVDAQIKGGSAVGGLIGNVHTGCNVTINNAVFAGSVSGTYQVGGIIGGHQVYNGARTLTIKNALNLGTVSASNDAAGGILGFYYSTTADSLTVQNCANLGTVSSKGKTGEICGSLSGYGATTVTPVSDAKISENIYNNENALIGGSKNYPMPLASALSLDQQTLTDLGFDAWTAGEDSPLPSSVATMLSNTSVSVSEWDGGTVSTELATDDEGAYLIQSAADLAYFASVVNGTKGNSYGGKIVKLTTDIDWNGNAWDCGTWNYFFAGTFDGQGHTISGLRLGNSQTSTGFFSYVSGTVAIKNLVLTDCVIYGNQNFVGGLVGGMQTNTVLTIGNVYVNADITGNNGVGGLIGNIHNGSTVTVNNAVFDGSVTAMYQAGGLVGGHQVLNVARTLTISNSLNLGRVTANDAAGGIVGFYNSSTANSLKVENSMNLGDVSAQAESGEIYGALAGYNTNTVTPASDSGIVNNVYNIEKPLGGDNTENVPMTATELQNIKVDALINTGFADWTCVALNQTEVPMPKTVATMLNAKTSLATQEIPFNHEKVKYNGRWVENADSMEGYWSGANLEIKFTGSILRVSLGTDAKVSVIADGKEAILYQSKDKTLYLSDLLDSSKIEHTVLIAIEDDSVSSLNVRKFELEAEKEVKDLDKKPIVEFVGDSITAGAFCDPESTNTFAFRTAQLLNVDYAPVAQGGIAIYSEDRASMSERYFWTAPLARTAVSGDGTDWDFARYTPDLIVIHLGTNDRSNDPATVTSTYVNFIQDIRAKRGDTLPIVMVIPLQGFMKDSIVAAHTQLNDPYTYLVDATDYLSLESGSDFYYYGNVHPSVSGHQKFAEKLAVDLRTVLLASLIDEAIASAEGIEVMDKTPAEVAVGTKFVTTAEMKALTDAIETANNVDKQTATLNDVLLARDLLIQTTASFIANVKTGTEIPVPDETITVVTDAETKTVIVNGKNPQTFLEIGGGTVSYDVATATVTLNGISAKQVIFDLYKNFTLNVVGENTLNAGSSVPRAMEVLSGSITVTGTGTLNVSAKNESIYIAVGSYIQDGATVNSVAVTNHRLLYSATDFVMNAGTFTGSSPSYFGIIAGRDVIVTGGKIDVVAAANVITAGENLTVSDGSVSATVVDPVGTLGDCALRSDKGNITLSGGEVTVSANNAVLYIPKGTLVLTPDVKLILEVNKAGAYGFAALSADGVRFVPGKSFEEKGGRVETLVGDEDYFTITCVGDSVTEGMATTGGLKGVNAYPFVLENLLNNTGLTRFNVVNCGSWGTTALTGSDKPYVNQPEYEKSKTTDPDVVIISLGTNDASRWTTEEQYKADFKALISEYLNLPSKPTVYLFYTTYVPGENRVAQCDRIQNVILPIQWQIAKELGVKIIDLNTLTKDNADKSADGLHPNDELQALMAEYVYNALCSENVAGLSEEDATASVSMIDPADATVTVNVTASGNAVIQLWNGDVLVEEKTAENGKAAFVFDNLTVGTNVLTLKQSSADADGWTYDKSEHSVSVTVDVYGNVSVKDNEISFTNTYDYVVDTDIVINATVSVTDKTLAEGDIIANLLKGEEIIATAMINAEGKISFTIDAFKDMAGVYTIALSTEIAGITLPEAQTITVTVVDNGDGTATVTATATELTFKGSYKVPFAEGEIKDGKYYVNGVPTEMGLVKIGNDHYYVGPNGVLVTGKYYAWRLNENCDITTGWYTFAEDGRMITDGIFDGYYYVDGKPTEMGLFQYTDGNYYVAQYDGKIIKAQEYYVWKIDYSAKDAFAAG